MDKAISPLDGRYGKRLEALGEYFSEYALMRSRVIVELRFLKALDQSRLFDKLTPAELKRIDDAEQNFSVKDYRQIKDIESKLNHDVKSCEVFLQEKLQLAQNNMIHFGLTSEDVNNLAYSFLFKEYVKDEQLPQLKELILVLTGLAEKWKDDPFPARTHGQMASPSTAGKEMAVFASRLLRQYKFLKDFKFRAKLNGATGNYSALLSAFPKYDWLSFSEDFLTEYGLEPNLVTTQIEDHDTWSAWFSISRQINNIILDLDRDIWLYLTLGYLRMQAKSGEVGSSTMPHKVNPINFENSEGNMQISITLLNGLSDKLGSSRLQRDLSDSTVTRNIGTAMGHSYLAIQETIKGLHKLDVNAEYCISELEAHPELLAEPIQTVLRKEGIDDPYNLLKSITRGKRVAQEELEKFVKDLPISQEAKKYLAGLKVSSYIGIAPQICQMVIEEVKNEFGVYK